VDAPSRLSDAHLPNGRPYVGDDALRKLEGVLDLVSIRLEHFTRISEPPRVLGERSCFPEQGLERRLVLEARKCQLTDVMCPAEEMVVVGEERLQRLLDRLLTVECRVGQEGWACGQVHFGCSQVELGTSQPGRNALRASVTRHTAERLP